MREKQVNSRANFSLFEKETRQTLRITKCFLVIYGLFGLKDKNTTLLRNVEKHLHGNKASHHLKTRIHIIYKLIS
jgi:acyl-ACP thioesterase